MCTLGNRKTVQTATTLCNKLKNIKMLIVRTHNHRLKKILLQHTLLLSVPAMILKIPTKTPTTLKAALTVNTLKFHER